MTKKFVWISIVIGLLGCSKAPALKVYSLNVPSVETTQRSGYHSKSIKVTYPQSLREQMSQKISADTAKRNMMVDESFQKIPLI